MSFAPETPPLCSFTHETMLHPAPPTPMTETCGLAARMIASIFSDSSISSILDCVSLSYDNLTDLSRRSLTSIIPFVNLKKRRRARIHVGGMPIEIRDQYAR